MQTLLKLAALAVLALASSCQALDKPFRPAELLELSPQHRALLRHAADRSSCSCTQPGRSTPAVTTTWRTLHASHAWLHMKLQHSACQRAKAP